MKELKKQWKFTGTLMDQNMEHYSPLIKKSQQKTVTLIKNAARNLGKLGGKEFITSRTVASHCVLHTWKSKKLAMVPFTPRVSGENDKDLKEIISKLLLFPLSLPILILSCPL